MAKNLFLTFIFISIAFLSFAQSFNIEASVGIQTSKVRFIPNNYFGLPFGWINRKSDINKTYDIGVKYYFNNLLFFGLNINYHRINTTGLAELSYYEYDENENIDGHSTIGSWDIERDQISNSVSVGYHLFRTGVFVEIGATYFYNLNHRLNGPRTRYFSNNKINTNLSDMKYGVSNSFGYNAGFGLRFEHKGIYFIGKFSFLFEKPSNTGANTSLEIGHNQILALFGVGYPIILKKNEEK